VIDTAPQVHPLAPGANYHLVELLSIARAWAASSKPAGKAGPELQNPPRHRFMGNLQASLGQQLLHVPVARCESGIKPDRVLNDRRREATSAVGDLIPTLPGHPLEPGF
jgi:hypothetical protein